MPDVPDVPVVDDVDLDILPVFVEEANELCAQVGEGLRAWQAQPGEAAVGIRLRRTLHTLKGSARMAGAMRLGDLAHRMESRLLEGEGVREPSTALLDELEADLDRIADMLEELQRGKFGSVAQDEVAAGAPGPAVGGAAIEATPPVVSVTEALPGPADVEPAQRALLRVRADIVDQLVNESGAVAVTRAQVDGELRALKANLLELKASVIRLRGQVREIELQGDQQIPSRRARADEAAAGFDPLEFDRYTRFQELARALAESVDDVATAEQGLRRSLESADNVLSTQGRLTREMEQQLLILRTVAFDSMAERFHRVVRQAGHDVGKRVQLDLRGGNVELDRAVLERLAGPLEHLLRNAVDHGIESAQIREAAGKSASGTVVLAVRQVGNEILVELSDDGGGLNLDAIRAKAIAHGRYPPEAALTEAQLVECMFVPGLTTATQVTAVSGRGIGLDVVRAEVSALGGRVEVSTRRGQGTTFALTLPLTLAVAQAVLVRAGGRVWALPAPMVEQVRQVEAAALLQLFAARNLDWQGSSYPFHYLPWLLGDVANRPTGARSNAVLLLHAGPHRTAVHVDEVLGNQEIVVKNIGPQLARVPGIAGAAVLGTGEIVLILNPVQLAQRPGIPVYTPDAAKLDLGPVGESGPASGDRATRVMIVDDSLTVRRVTSRMLAREGFEVTIARDGVEALELLDTQSPDVILLDIEMPRMDGFEFMRKLRPSPRFRDTPVIMVTSRAAEKHRALARELGVNLYLGKPFQEEELLTNLRRMISLTR